jgi:peptide/nickel transport system substrate-binding protein
MKKILLPLLILILLVVVGFLFYSYKEKTSAPKELVYALPNEVNTLDPHKITDVYTAQVLAQMYEGLVGLDKNNQLVPVLAESWSTDDYKTWKFKIRKNVFFHDGTLLKPSDVLFSFQRLSSKDSTLAWLFTGLVKDMRIESPDTFVIELNQPEKFFLNRITHNVIAVVPESIKNMSNFGTEVAIGTGPFKLLKKTDTEIILARNEKYWRKTNGNVSTLRFVVIKNDQVRLSEFKAGRVHLMDVPLSLAQVVNNSPDIQKNFQFSSFPTFNIHFVGFNTKVLDQHLRRAINLAIDRREISRVGTSGLGIPNSSPLPTTFKGLQEGDIYNLEEARKELSLVKSIPKLELVVSDKNNAPVVAEIIQNQLKKIGLDISIKQVDFNTLVDNIIKGKTDLFLAWFELMFSSPEPVLIDALHSSKIPVPNFWKLEDKELDQMLEKLKEPGSENLISEILKRFNGNPPFAPLFTLKTTYIHPKYVKNVYLNGHNLPLLEEIYIEK